METTIADREGYLSRMARTLQEKLRIAGYLPPGVADVLDVGCADGTVTCSLATLCPATRFLGIDLDPGFVARAAERASGALDTLARVNHLLLKYWYVENWDREGPEHYVPVTFERYEAIFRLLGLTQQVANSTLLPFLRQKWRTDFGLTADDLAPLRSTGILVAQKA